MLLIDDMRPRNSSGVLSWLMVERRIELMVSPAPVSVSMITENQKICGLREQRGGQTVNADADDDPAAAPSYRAKQGHADGGKQRADGASGIEQSESCRPDEQNVAGEDRK